jgi:hypothetical protein
LQLLVRTHPGEIYGHLRSRQLVSEELSKRFRALPANVVVVGPESRISTHEMMAMCDSVVIYGTKMGVELAAQGIPVVVAGEAWVRDKGVTIEPANRGEYLSILDQLPIGTRMDPPTTRRARRYAYHFFFRRMIPVAELKARHGHPPYELAIDRIEQLDATSSEGFALIMRGILEGSPFIYPAELDGTRLAPGR